MKRSLVWRADLLQALATDGPDAESALADMLGWDAPPPEKSRPSVPPLSDEPKTDVAQQPASSPETPVAWEKTPYWLARRLTPRDDQPVLNKTLVAKRRDVSKSRTSTDHAGTPPPFVALSSANRIMTRLRTCGALRAPTGAIDVDRMVRELSRARELRVLPRRRRRSWGDRVVAIVDNERHLTPYWDDQEDVLDALRRVFPPGGVVVQRLNRAWTGSDMTSHMAWRIPGGPPEKGLVIALTDLGSLAPDDGRMVSNWLELGRWLQQRGNRTLAIVPWQRCEFAAELARVWRLTPWEDWRGSRLAMPSADEIDRAARRVLSLVWFVQRLEPQLIRRVRRLIGGDASLESWIWQHAILRDRHFEAATLEPAEIESLTAAAQQEPESLRLAVDREWRTVRSDLYYDLSMAERIARRAADDAACVSESELAEAVHWIHGMAERLREMSERERGEGDMSAWFRQVLNQMPGAAWQLPDVKAPIHDLWQSVHPWTKDARAPRGLDPAALGGGPRDAARVLEIAQIADQWEFRETVHLGHVTAATLRSPLGTITSRNGELVIDPIVVDRSAIQRDAGSIVVDRSAIQRNSNATDDDQAAFWAGGVAPPWAVDWGHDDYGPWAEFEVKGVRQRLRWIPPGSFLMGSPENEPERYSDEGPRHEVTLTRGFWLADTACTQELWQAVMGKNPSRFKGEQNPVERVSWNDVQEFLKRLSQAAPGFQAELPTEAQWEYACRAGTDTPFSFGATITPEQVNYDGNYPYAGGKKGKYRQTTVSVKELPANSWGLYQMHGNVWEWCRDGKRQYAAQSARDPVGPTETVAARVFRGGSWGSLARVVRCAYRGAGVPSDRNGNLGFRLSGVPQCGEPAAGGGRAQRAVRESQPAERCGDREPASEARWVRLRGAHAAAAAIPRDTSAVVLSDVERLEIQRVTRPDWAVAMGRDEYGLWADLALHDIVQRMRWIPPGRFWMGSPDDEPGRDSDEGPRHEVLLTNGYWLGDTPCTQALWEAVMGNNPSRFVSPDRPVEQVSWDDCQGFLKSANTRIRGLTLQLPTEAEWEYACRAGTSTATYAGPIEIVGAKNAPALDAIAWYGGNSGVGFELSNGFDTSDWIEKQYEHKRAGTRLIKTKGPNEWGLYDMLGNVYEWCADGKRDYITGVETDPSGSAKTVAARVIRGGCRYSSAGSVRCAYRNAIEPSLRGDDLGFRLSGVPQW